MSDVHTGTDERKPRTKKRGGRFVLDAELIELLGVPEKIAREALHELDRDPRSGFPKKQALWGNRRYWPAVEAYLDEHYGTIVPGPRGGPSHDRSTKN